MSSINTDLLVGILSERHPHIASSMIERLVNNSKLKDFQKIIDEVEEQLVFEEQKEITPPRHQRKHLLDFTRSW